MFSVTKAQQWSTYKQSYYQDPHSTRVVTSHLPICFLLVYTFCLTGVRPDVLEQTILLSKSVQGVISLTSSSDVSTQSVGGVRAWDSSSFLVNIGNVDLDRSVVLGFDDSVSGRALSWNVQFNLPGEKLRRTFLKNPPGGNTGRCEVWTFDSHIEFGKYGSQHYNRYNVVVIQQMSIFNSQSNASPRYENTTPIDTARAAMPV
ncbi:hypothetical protein OGAPHI_005539 [Ogataea philodendri]|uniref:Uncharacterized protein n=1 Tax=Ogataea philodendri TaxID=1378263 RepID=A0A9P8NZE9_9ASCO|nr:uncharacterized protein OGAPHI_005539 [Ogataea philodendri]KAH3662289.1 hypothetical protein OGAPHI_005539 [Ogataea philodendri]